MVGIGWWRGFVLLFAIELALPRSASLSLKIAATAIASHECGEAVQRRASRAVGVG
jgi:hypothetical protein